MIFFYKYHTILYFSLSGSCSHVIGLLKTLQGLKLNNFKDVPDQLSCTSLPQAWDVSCGSKIQPVPFSHLVVVKPKDKRKRKPIICQINTDTKYDASL